MKLIEILVKLEKNEIPNKTKFKWKDRVVINKKGTLYWDDVSFSKILNFGNAEALKEELEIIEEDKPIEIIEDTKEDKPIEKITIDLNYANHYSKANVKANGKYLAEKINEIIDVVNELKESRGKIRWD